MLGRQLDKHTEPDHIDEFLIQYEQQHNNKTTYNEQSYNSYNENMAQSKSQERTHNKSESKQSNKTTKTVLVTGLITEKETNLMMITLGDDMED